MILILIVFSVIVTVLSHKYVVGIPPQFLITIFSSFSFWVLFFWGLLGIVGFNVDCEYTLSSTENIIVATGFVIPATVFIGVKLALRLKNRKW